MKNNNILILFLDIFFVLFLCFALLMFTMILNRGEEMQASGIYVIDPLKFGALIISVFAYLYFMTKTSVRELSSILSSVIDLLSSETAAKENGIEE